MEDGKIAEASATDYQWQEVTCQRAVGGDNFVRGVMEFPWSVGPPTAWCPGLSYFKAEVEILADAGVAPAIHHGIALAEGAMNNAFVQANFYAGNVSASSIVSLLPVAAQAKVRTNAQGAWQETIGKGAWGYNPSLAERIADVSTSSAVPGGVGTVGLSGLDDGREVIYRPLDPAAPYVANAYAAATMVVTTAAGVSTATTIPPMLFTAADVGATLVVQGIHYTVTSTAGATAVVSTGAASPGTTNDWYMIKREVHRSTQTRNRVQVCFQPPIGIMDYKGLLGAGNYRFQLSPNVNFQQSAVETNNPDPAFVPGNVVNTYKFNVLDVRLYVATVKMRIPDETQTIHLKEYQVMSRTMNSKQQVLNFAVPSSTVSLHVMLQDQTAGTSAYSPPSRFTVANGSDLNLERIQLSYSGTTKPSTPWLTQFSYDGAQSRTAFLQQFYEQNLIENRLDSHSAETFDAFLMRGPLYSFRYDRDAEDRSTEVQLQIAYRDPVEGSAPGTPGAFAANPQLVLIAVYDRTVQITHEGGLITAVRALDV